MFAAIFSGVFFDHGKGDVKPDLPFRSNRNLSCYVSMTSTTIHWRSIGQWRFWSSIPISIQNGHHSNHSNRSLAPNRRSHARSTLPETSILHPSRWHHPRRKLYTGLFHSFIHSFVHSFVHSSIHPVIDPFIYSHFTSKPNIWIKQINK